MRKLLLFILFLLIYCSIKAQCPQGDIILTTQLEVDNFSTDYPSCTEITDKLIIGVWWNTSDITDISNLPPIESIGSDLEIEANVNLTDLSALENLTSIGGKLEINNNDALIDLSGLENLTSIGGTLIICNNGGLTDLSGLENLTSSGELFIDDNNALINLSALENLTSIGGLFIICNNSGLTDLTSLENLTSIGGLFMLYNDGLTDLSGLENLTSISDLWLYDNAGLTDLSGLENLTSISGELFIDDNDALINLSALENLTSITRNLYILNNDALINLSGLENLTSIGEDMRITDNENLYDLNGIQNINTNSLEVLHIERNSRLSVCNLPNICNYLENGGTSYINSNAYNCHSSEEVLNACALLPVELDKLQVYLENQTAILTWRTLTETNNAGFEIQRSKDGIAWERIGWQVGQGNTLTPHSYTYGDENPLFGTSYYQLKQVDFNSDFEYSDKVSLQYTRPDISISPNPTTNGKFTIKGIPVGTYQILNTSGQIVGQGDIQNDLLIDISHQAQGVYFISIQIDNKVVTKRIIKL